MARKYYTDLEVAPREHLRIIQEERLREQVRHAYENSPFYREKFDAEGLKPEDIQSLDDLHKMPFTTKDELKESQQVHEPWGNFLAVPFEKVNRIHLTSGTTGRPVAFLDTRDDWKGFYESYARGLWAMGVRPSDMAMAAFGFGPWIGFWSGFFAAQSIGCTMIPVGGLSTEQRIDYMLTYPVTVLGCTPSYAIYLAEAARKRGIDLAKEAKIRITWHTGEPGANIPATKKKIEESFGAKCFDLPGLTEIAAWGFECEYQSGLVHIHEDYVYPEILDPETWKPVAPGEKGELVFTSLYRKAMPMLRYRTRDIVRLADRPCPCGRTLVSIDGGIIGRVDDMKKIRGVIVYPTQVEEVVRKYDEVDEYRIIISRVGGLDDLKIKIDPKPEVGEDRLQGVLSEIQSELRVILGIRVTMEGVEPGTLPRWDQKARRVEDQREDVPF